MRTLAITASLLVVAGALNVLSPAALRAELQELRLEEQRARIGPRTHSRNYRTQLPPWIIKAGRLYMDQDNTEAMDQLLILMEDNLGINADGSLDIIKAWDCKYALSGDLDLLLEEWQYQKRDASWLYYLKDNLSLTGLNKLYFQICTTYQDRYADRFVIYFENGFYPNRALFTKNAHYYQVLYYYLYLIAPSVNDMFSRTINFLYDNPDATPKFITSYDLRRFNIGVAVATELDMFVSQKTAPTTISYEQVFSNQERTWIKNTTDYFLNAQTHSVLLSYDWFRKNMPLDASAEAISYNILKSWEEQAVIYRNRLPLMFFTEEGETLINIEALFDATLQKLRLDNRKADIMILTALQTWLSKQVRHGIKIDDRIKYNNILAELKACPSGWVFANLYDCKRYLAELEVLAERWGEQRNPEHVFKTQVVETFLNAKEKIDFIFNDLEKIFGKNQNPGPINYIFNQYRGEVTYCFKYIQFETFQGKNTIMPVAGPEANYLNDFKAAFLAAPDNSRNHINLLKGYNLLFRELAAAGRIDEIQKRAWELDTFVKGRYRLGERLPHEENTLYDIYRVLTYAYLSYESLHAKALETAQKGFLLAKNYYAQAARAAGYATDEKIGVITRENTEMDDYQRQFELYKTVANKMGKKIQLLVAEDDIHLYKKMQELRKLGI